jgi:hypothetical protein
MSTEGEQSVKYRYKFSLSAPKRGSAEEEAPSKAEIQAYINELLGIPRPKKPSEDATEK